MTLNKSLLLLSLSGFAALNANAGIASPPGQPTNGPGGSTYTYSSYKQFGMFYANPLQREPYSSFYIFEPTGSNVPKTLPVVLFLHAYLAVLEGYPVGDSPSNYTYWIQHLVRNGYTVVFPTYDDQPTGQTYTDNIINSWQAALTMLESGTPGLIAPKKDAYGYQTAFVGHSLGAYECFATAQQLTTNPILGVPPPRAIAAFNPGIGTTSLPLTFPQISPSIFVVLVDADEDTQDIPSAQAIWKSIGTMIPSGNRDFLEVITDEHGMPALIGDHFFPNTNGLDDNTSVDDRDYNVTWKLSVGLFNCVLNDTDCSYGLGHGAYNQINMGVWSDGTPATPLSLQN